VKAALTHGHLRTCLRLGLLVVSPAAACSGVSSSATPTLRQEIGLRDEVGKLASKPASKAPMPNGCRRLASTIENWLAQSKRRAGYAARVLIAPPRRAG
jgi:hypothetical protein